jgi:hypothetical protein
VSAVYLFFDESGDLHFSKSGSPYYYFGALTTTDPVPLSNALTALRYELMHDGLELERFHASEDRQAVRDRVFSAIAATGRFEFDAVVVEKRKTHPTLHDEVRFYPKFAAYLLNYVFARYTDPSQRVIVVTDSLPMKRKRNVVEKAFKLFIREKLGDRDFSIMHHASAAHPCLQAADYCTWAVHKKWASGDTRPIAVINSFVRSEFDIFANGDEYFY